MGYSFEGWTLDLARRRLSNPAGAAVSLTELEFDLLLMFVENPRTMLKKEELIEGLKTETKDALTQLLSRLRRKIRTDGAAPFIVNEYGHGFMFTPDVRILKRLGR